MGYGAFSAMLCVHQDLQETFGARTCVRPTPLLELAGHGNTPLTSGMRLTNAADEGVTS
jgi:hypothetical protein